MSAGRVRWRIFSLLMVLNLVNYFDRQVLALVAPTLHTDLGLSEVDYGRLVALFQVSFAMVSPLCGRFVDAVGVRLGVLASVLWFSLAQIGHTLARGPLGFSLARVGLAIGEAPTYPGTLKGVAEWAPQAERSSAAGLVHFGVMLGAVIAPLVVPYLTQRWGWQSGFLATGVAGLILLIPWWLLFASPEAHHGLSAQERELILSQRGSPASAATVPWTRLLRQRQFWAYVAILAIVNPAWWFLTYWMPKFLAESFGISGVALTPYATTVYAMAAVGAVAGGQLSSQLLRRNFGINAARKLSMLLCGLVMPIVIVAGYTRSPWTAVFVIGIAAIVHQTWATTGVAVLGDWFPAHTVGTVVGIGSLCASLLGMVAAEATGQYLQVHPGRYLPMFIYTGFAYLIATALVQWLCPRIEPVRGL